MTRFEKDFRQLCRQINSIGGGQVRVSRDNIFYRSTSSTNSCDSSDDEDNRNTQDFFVEITPKDGPYAHASYVFRIETKSSDPYPDCQPYVSCLTPIYHPNIDTTYNNVHNNVCVSTLNDWDGGPTSTFEDLVQGLMFLFYHPNVDDPLTSNVSTDTDEFLRNVRISIEGGEIEDFDYEQFDVNYGYKKYLLEQEKVQQKPDEGEQVDDYLVSLLKREPDFKTIFTPDTLEYLMYASPPSTSHASRSLKEGVSSS